MRKNLQNDVRIGFLEAKNAEQDREIAELKNKLNSKQDIRLPIPGDSLNKPTVPSSCKDLATSGHSFQGLYLVKNPDTSQIQTVLCGFEASGNFIKYSLYLFLTNKSPSEFSTHFSFSRSRRWINKLRYQTTSNQQADPAEC